MSTDTMTSDRLSRTRLLLGEAATARLAAAQVAVIGLGGVGGACCEALARSGVGRLILVDADTVMPSNLNRQLVATKASLGRLKTEAMAERVAAVSEAVCRLVNTFVTPENVDALFLDRPDFIVDAIDFVPGKLALIRYAKENDIPILSCLGAGNRLDPTKLVLTDIYKTEGDPLARKLRQLLRKEGIDRLPVVFSKETPRVSYAQTCIGSLMPVTATAGMVAAAYVIQTLTEGEAR